MGDQIRAGNTALNLKLAALGIYTRARTDKTPKLHSDDWVKLVALAETGKAVQAMGETWRRLFPEDQA